MRVPPRIVLFKFILGLEHTHKVLLVVLTSTFNHEVGVIRSKTQKLFRFESANNLELDDVLSDFDLVSINFENASSYTWLRSY